MKRVHVDPVARTRRPPSTRVDEKASGRPAPSASWAAVRAAAADVDRAAAELDAARDSLAAAELDAARDSLAAAIRQALETGYSLRQIAGAAGLSHEAIRRYRWRK